MEMGDAGLIPLTCPRVCEWSLEKSYANGVMCEFAPVSTTQNLDMSGKKCKGVADNAVAVMSEMVRWRSKLTMDGPESVRGRWRGAGLGEPAAIAEPAKGPS